MKNKEAVKISKYISEFLIEYAPIFLTTSEHTLKSYKDTLTIYINFLEDEGITPIQLNIKYFEKDYIERWIRWLKNERKCCPSTCNVRLGALRVFLKYLGTKNLELLYLFIFYSR
jgi:site-specific recombinase XerD